jgi:hypothetical protein
VAATQVKATVTEFLERARDCAALAEQLDGDDKNKMIEIAEAWLKLADEAAKTALKIDNELPRK